MIAIVFNYMDGILLIIFIFFLIFAALLALEVFKSKDKNVPQVELATGGDLTEPMEQEV